MLKVPKPRGKLRRCGRTTTSSGVWYVKYRDAKGKEFASVPAYWLDCWPAEKKNVVVAPQMQSVPVDPQFLKSDIKPALGGPRFGSAGVEHKAKLRLGDHENEQMLSTPKKKVGWFKRWFWSGIETD